MNPKTMCGQAVGLSIACALMGITSARTGALVIGLAVAIEWLGFATYNENVVRKVRNPAGSAAVAQRRRGDRHVRWQVVLVLAAAVGAPVATSDAVFDAGWVATCSAAGAAAAWVLYASSLVDWGYVRARVDGIVHEPPWRVPDDALWFRVTRIQYLHRSVSELVVLMAVVVGVTTIISTPLSLSGGEAAGIGAALTGLILLVAHRAIATFRDEVLDGPDHCIGEVLLDERGVLLYVHSVRVGGISVLEWDPTSETWSRRPRKISDNALDEQRFERLRLSDRAGGGHVPPGGV